MKIHKLAWKTKDGHTLLATWELGSQKLAINAYEIDAEQANELIHALKEASDLMQQSMERLEVLSHAQRRD